MENKSSDTCDISSYLLENTIFFIRTPFKLVLTADRALLHFLDPGKFSSKDDFVEKYKNLSSFNEFEVQHLACIIFPFNLHFCIFCFISHVVYRNYDIVFISFISDQLSKSFFTIEFC